MPGCSMIFVPFKTNPKPKNNSKKSTPSQVVRFVILKKKTRKFQPQIPKTSRVFKKNPKHSKKIRKKQNKSRKSDESKNN